MKNFWKYCLILLGSMLLVACNNSNIGIIGGEDGPTSIFIGK